jgi:acetyltransferase
MDLNSIFYPKSIAVIGASTVVGQVGNDILKNLTTQGYKGRIFPVNPKTTELYGLKCYPDVLIIPEKIDLAIIVVPGAIVPAVLETVAKKKIKAAIIISAGFKEVENIELENQVKNICQK